MSGKKKKAGGEIMLITLDGERLEMVTSAYETLCHVIDKYDPDQEKPTLDEFIKDCLGVGCTYVMKLTLDSVKKAEIMALLHGVFMEGRGRDDNL